MTERKDREGSYRKGIERKIEKVNTESEHDRKKRNERSIQKVNMIKREREKRSIHM